MEPPRGMYLVTITCNNLPFHFNIIDRYFLCLDSCIETLNFLWHLFLLSPEHRSIRFIRKFVPAQRDQNRCLIPEKARFTCLLRFCCLEYSSGSHFTYCNSCPVFGIYWVTAARKSMGSPCKYDNLYTAEGRNTFLDRAIDGTIYRWVYRQTHKACCSGGTIGADWHRRLPVRSTGPPDLRQET